MLRPQGSTLCTVSNVMAPWLAPCRPGSCQECSRVDNVQSLTSSDPVRQSPTGELCPQPPASLDLLPPITAVYRDLPAEDHLGHSSVPGQQLAWLGCSRPLKCQYYHNVITLYFVLYMPFFELYMRSLRKFNKPQKTK